MIAKQRKKKSNMGAPLKPESEKIQGNHLRADQQLWLEEQAAIRKISMYKMLRICVDTARDQFDKKYGDAAAANAMFDATLGESMSGKK